MKKWIECNVDMIEDSNLHTDYIGEFSADDRIYISFANGAKKIKNLFGKEKTKENKVTEKLRARVCPNCGKVEMYINILDMNKN